MAYPEIMEATNLNAERAKKFLELLAQESFVCVVATDTELRLFSKGIDQAQLDRIQQKLVESEEGDN